jgi:hypothetical protein
MHNLPYEVFAAILLDTQHRIIRFHEFFFGSIDCATVHPRIIAQKVLYENAAAIILVHNHSKNRFCTAINRRPGFRPFGRWAQKMYLICRKWMDLTY